MAQILNADREARQRQVDNAIASVRLEGLEPTAAAKVIFGRYVDGDISATEMSAEIRALNAREFGPVSIPGD